MKIGIKSILFHPFNGRVVQAIKIMPNGDALCVHGSVNYTVKAGRFVHV